MERQQTTMQRCRLLICICIFYGYLIFRAELKLCHAHGNREARLFLGETFFNDVSPVEYCSFYNEAAVLTSDSPPKDDRFWPTVGNGHVATVVHSDTVFMNGLYNGAETNSRRARIPAVTSVNISQISSRYTNRNYTLDMNRGMYMETYSGSGWSVQLKVYAHRTLTRLLVTEMTLRSDVKLQEAIDVALNVNVGPESDALNLRAGTSDFPKANFMFGEAMITELPTSERVPLYIYYSNVPKSVSLPRDAIRTDVHVFLASFSPFQNEAREYYQMGLEMSRNQTLESSHVTAWSDVWERGRLDVEGNTSLASATYSALYYILSAMPTQSETTWPFVGLSPEGLAHGNKYEEYGGHVFWDQETWMYPTMLCLHSDLGKTLVGTRFRTLNSAYRYAKQRGYKGAMYPWESAFTGMNVSPGGRWAKYEHHITGDIALAYRQFLMMTHDSDIIHHGRLVEAVTSIADFWVSRVYYNQSTGLYEILDVMPPDEWNYPVNNSVYTNTVARISLLLPGYVHTLGGPVPHPLYKQIASRLYIPFDTNRQYHPEFEGFTLDTQVKQADVVLLGYPLMATMSEEVRLNDLEIYENLTALGPAMTWGMFAIGWLELGQPDRATELFYNQLENKQQPFNVWTEVSDGTGATNFITGMGGFLQSILFGYGGLRMFESHITIDPTPIPGTSGLNISGLDYLGSSFNIRCDPELTSVTLTTQGDVTLFAYVYGSKETLRLELGQTAEIRRQKFAITTEQNLQKVDFVKSKANSINSVSSLFISVIVCAFCLTIGFI